MNKNILNPRQLKIWDREQKRLDERRVKIKANGGKWCRHTSTLGQVGGKKMMCLDCDKILDNPEKKN